MKSSFIFVGLFFFLILGSSAQGLVFSDSAIYEATTKKQLFSKLNAAKLPEKVDLSIYVPSVMSQGKLSTCVGVSVGYYLRTMLEAIQKNETDESAINALRFSPSYLYNAIKEPGTSECDMGTQIVKAFEHLRKNGIVPYEKQPYPSCQVDESLVPSDESKILDYQILFNLSRDAANKVLLTKKALAEKTPVVVGIQTTPSLQSLGFWQSIWLRILKFFWVDDDEDNSYSLWKPEKSDRLAGGHAVCLTGYDDTKYGGAFQAVNSYGENWGDAGFFWIRYSDYLKFTKYGFQAFAPTKRSEGIAELSGELLIQPPAEVDNQGLPFFRNDPTSVSGVDNSDKYVSYFLDKQVTGTKYRVRVNVTQQAYVYVISENSTERETKKLFPEGFERQPPIGKNTIVQFPNDSSFYKLVPPAGTEYFMVLFSTQPIEDIDDYVDEIMDGEGSFGERVNVALGDKLVPREQITFMETKVGFELKKEHRGEIVPLIVAFEHAPNISPF